MLPILVCIAGDPVEAVLLALEAAEKVFGVEVNSLGYKVPKSCGVIQGDGINIHMLDNILQAVLARGFSAQVCLMLGRSIRAARQHLCHVMYIGHPLLFLLWTVLCFPFTDTEFMTHMCCHTNTQETDCTKLIGHDFKHV